jgi:hypothetical protein
LPDNALEARVAPCADRTSKFAKRAVGTGQGSIGASAPVSRQSEARAEQITESAVPWSSPKAGRMQSVQNRGDA